MNILHSSKKWAVRLTDQTSGSLQLGGPSTTQQSRNMLGIDQCRDVRSYASLFRGLPYIALIGTVSRGSSDSKMPLDLPVRLRHSRLNTWLHTSKPFQAKVSRWEKTSTKGTKVFSIHSSETSRPCTRTPANPVTRSHRPYHNNLFHLEH